MKIANLNLKVILKTALNINIYHYFFSTVEEQPIPGLLTAAK